MKNTRIENLIKQLRFKATDDTRSRILNNILSTRGVGSTCGEPCRTKPHHPNIWRIITKSPVTKLAAAACIIISIYVFITPRGLIKQNKKMEVMQSVVFPADLTTLASLDSVFRNGGMDAVDKQLDEAFRKLGPWPVNSQSKVIQNYSICMRIE